MHEKKECNGSQQAVVKFIFSHDRYGAAQKFTFKL